MVFTWGCYVLFKNNSLFFMNFRPWCRDCLMEKATSHYSLFRIEVDDQTGSIGLSNVHLARTPRTDFLQEETWIFCLFFFSELPEPLRCANFRVVLNLGSMDGTLTRDPENRRSIGKVPAYEASRVKRNLWVPLIYSIHNANQGCFQMKRLGEGLPLVEVTQRMNISLRFLYPDISSLLLFSPFFSEASFSKSCFEEDSWEAVGRHYAQEVLPILLAIGLGCWTLHQWILCPVA